MKNIIEIIKDTYNMKLLYVEDDKSVRESTLEVLNEIFSEIIVAVDGQDGLGKFYDNEIDIIISAIKMPNLSGIDMCESIRKYDKDVPIIFLSAYSEPQNYIKSIHLNVDDYLLKPLKFKDLTPSLEKIIKKLKLLKDFNNSISFLEQYQELTDIDKSVSKTDLSGIITYVNQQFCDITGYTQDELIGKSHNIVRHPETPASLYTDLWHTIKTKKEYWKGIVKNISKDGSVYYQDIIVKPILDADGKIVEYISLRTNVTDIMSPHKQLHDFVTYATEPFMILIRIDAFEDIEKFYGHEISQLMYHNFAKELKSYIPTSINFEKFFSLDFGNYVFIKDLKSEDKSSISSILDELRNFQYLINELRIDVGDIDYDISILISASYGEKCIENTTYGMKYLEKNKQEFIFSNHLSEHEELDAKKNLRTIKMIKQAIDDMKIISFFQPIVSNKTKKITKYESLVRLINEDGEIISPFFFLDIAKKGKYYGRITSIVLENSFKALNLFDEDISVSINLSAIDIETSITRNKIYELLEKNKKIANRVVFELLEDEEVKNLDELSSFITNVKNYGVRIAIDDFGAGYSNFERLLKYQPDILKIDGSLIRDIETNSYSLSVVKTIVSFAKEQNIEVIAEYIENENIFDIINSLGVEYSQGYYFGKPKFFK